MRVFVTGATGYVGTAVVNELINAGHQVLGLARNENAANALLALGAEVHHGDLENLESLVAGVKAADGVIHAGFIHDFTRFNEVCEIDKKAIETMGSVLIGTEIPFVVTSGTLVASPGKLATEETIPDYINSHNPRVASEQAVDLLAAKGVNVSVVRLSPSVHGEGDHHGFIPMLIDIAKRKGVSAYIGDGLNRWTAINRLDAAVIYRLALTNVKPGVRFHGVAEEAITLKSIAEIIGRKLNLPVESKNGSAAAEHFEWFEHFASVDGPATATITREELKWAPKNPTLLDDLEKGVYF